jgi:hypothetical protein
MCPQQRNGITHRSCPQQRDGASRRLLGRAEASPRDKASRRLRERGRDGASRRLRERGVDGASRSLRERGRDAASRRLLVGAPAPLWGAEDPQSRDRIVAALGPTKILMDVPGDGLAKLFHDRGVDPVQRASRGHAARRIIASCPLQRASRAA